MRVPLGISARPFDFFVAFLVFFAGMYGFLDPNWPPEGPVGSGYYILLVEDLYMVVAGAVIMAALIIKQVGLRKRSKQHWIVPAIVGEMFGWLFVSVSSLTISLTAWVLPPTALDVEFTNSTLFAWSFFWAALAAASFMRWHDMRNIYRKGGSGRA